MKPQFDNSVLVDTFHQLLIYADAGITHATVVSVTTNREDDEDPEQDVTGLSSGAVNVLRLLGPILDEVGLEALRIALSRHYLIPITLSQVTSLLEIAEHKSQLDYAEGNILSLCVYPDGRTESYSNGVVLEKIGGLWRVGPGFGYGTSSLMTAHLRAYVASVANESPDAAHGASSETAAPDTTVH
jgi:hypothetical protein